MPRQGELALGLVRPVRNDLMDSDVVVVCGEASRPVAVADAFRPSLDDARPVWSRLKAQLFGAEKL
jgi:hypothetical protein